MHHPGLCRLAVAPDAVNGVSCDLRQRLCPATILLQTGQDLTCLPLFSAWNCSQSLSHPIPVSELKEASAHPSLSQMTGDPETQTSASGILTLLLQCKDDSYHYCCFIDLLF